MTDVEYERPRKRARVDDVDSERLKSFAPSFMAESWQNNISELDNEEWTGHPWFRQEIKAICTKYIIKDRLNWEKSDEINIRTGKIEVDRGHLKDLPDVDDEDSDCESAFTSDEDGIVEEHDEDVLNLLQRTKVVPKRTMISEVDGLDESLAPNNAEHENIDNLDRFRSGERSQLSEENITSIFGPKAPEIIENLKLRRKPPAQMELVPPKALVKPQSIETYDDDDLSVLPSSPAITTPVRLFKGSVKATASGFSASRLLQANTRAKLQQLGTPLGVTLTRSIVELSAPSTPSERRPIRSAHQPTSARSPKLTPPIPVSHRRLALTQIAAEHVRSTNRLRSPLRPITEWLKGESILPRESGQASTTPSKISSDSNTRTSAFSVRETRSPASIETPAESVTAPASLDRSPRPADVMDLPQDFCMSPALDDTEDAPLSVEEVSAQMTPRNQAAAELPPRQMQQDTQEVFESIKPIAATTSGLNFQAQTLTEAPEKTTERVAVKDIMSISGLSALDRQNAPSYDVFLDPFGFAREKIQQAIAQVRYRAESIKSLEELEPLDQKVKGRILEPDLPDRRSIKVTTLYRCQACYETEDTLTKLKAHIRDCKCARCHGIFECHLCKKRFEGSEDFISHCVDIKSVCLIAQGMRLVEVAQTIPVHPRILARWRERAPDPTHPKRPSAYQCSTCRRCFHGMHTLQKHMQRAECVPMVGAHECPVGCLAVYPTPAKVKHHLSNCRMNAGLDVFGPDGVQIRPKDNAEIKTYVPPISKPDRAALARRARKEAQKLANTSTEPKSAENCADGSRGDSESEDGGRSHLPPSRRKGLPIKVWLAKKAEQDLPLSLPKELVQSVTRGYLQSSSSSSSFSSGSGSEEEHTSGAAQEDVASVQPPCADSANGTLTNIEHDTSEKEHATSIMPSLKKMTPRDISLFDTDIGPLGMPDVAGSLSPRAHPASTAATNDRSDGPRSRPPASTVELEPRDAVDKQARNGDDTIMDVQRLDGNDPVNGEEDQGLSNWLEGLTNELRSAAGTNGSAESTSLMSWL